MLAVRARARRADARPGTASTASRSTSTARAGTSARSPTTRCSSRPPRANSAAPASAPSPTGCATRCAAAARSTTTRACRASARGAVHRPQRRRRSTARRPSSGPAAARPGPDQARAGRQPARLHASRTRAGATVSGRRRSTTTARPPATPTSPTRSISYVDAHDNETLFDALTYKLPVATSMADRVRMNTLSLATTALGADAVVLARRRRPAAQQVAGPQLLRLAATGSTASTGPGADNGFGHGLPPEARQRGQVAVS